MTACPGCKCTGVSQLVEVAEDQFKNAKLLLIQIAWKPNSLTVPCTLLWAVTKNRIFLTLREGGLEDLPHLYRENRDS